MYIYMYVSVAEAAIGRGGKEGGGGGGAGAERGISIGAPIADSNCQNFEVKVIEKKLRN